MSAEEAAPIQVLVVAYRTRARTLALLDDLARLGPRVRVRVWDNASGDGSAEAFAAHGVEVTASPRNLGYAGALAAALPELEGELLWLLNGDLLLPRAAETLARLEQALAADPRAAAVGPALVDLDGRQPSGGGGAELGLASAAGHFLGLGHLGLRAFYLAPRAHRGRPPFEVDWICGAAPLLRLAALRAVGVPRESFLYAEDLALSRRLREAGHRVLYHPGAEVVHEGQGSQPRPDGRWVTATLDDYARRAPAPAARVMASLFAGGLGARAVVRRLRGERALAKRLALEARTALRWRP
ncbi:MAG: glycosyltransferase [Planctomycetota bacterium]